jgi:GPN-loop GTPase
LLKNSHKPYSVIRKNEFVQMQIPHVNVMSKLDLLNKQAKKQLLDKFLEPDMMSLLDEDIEDEYKMKSRFQKLNYAIATVVNFFGGF